MHTSKANLSTIGRATGWMCCKYCHSAYLLLKFLFKKERRVIKSNKHGFLTCWAITNRINMGKPIWTQLASCRGCKDGYEPYRFLIFIINNWMKFEGGKKNTCGKPLANKPRPTTQTDGTKTTGLMNLFKMEKGWKKLIWRNELETALTCCLEEERLFVSLAQKTKWIV